MKVTPNAAIVTGAVGIAGIMLGIAFVRPFKAPPAAAPTPTATGAGIVAVAPTPEVAAVTITPAPASAQIVGFLPSPTSYSGKFQRNYADNLDLAAGRLYLRENFGVSVWSLADPSAPSLVAVWDLEADPLHRKVGDGYNTVTTIAAADDGSRVLVNWNQDTHGTILLRPSGLFAGEFAPQRTVGGVAVVREGGRYIGLSLRSSGLQALSRADVSTFVSGAAASQIASITRSLLDAPGGAGLVSDGSRAAVYVTASGGLATYQGGGVSVQDGLGAYAVAIAPGHLAVARRVGTADVLVADGVEYPMPGLVTSICWAGSTWFAWTGDGSKLWLQNASGRILTVDPMAYPRPDGVGSLIPRAAVCRGFASGGVTWLYVGTRDATAIVRVG